MRTSEIIIIAISSIAFLLPELVSWLFPSAGVSEITELKKLLNELIKLLLSLIGQFPS